MLGAKNSKEMGSNRVLNRFDLVVQRISHSKDYIPNRSPDAPYGIFKKRHLIGEHTHINGGVYLGATPQEAVVIDDRFNDSSLDAVFSEWVINFVRYYQNTKSSEDECEIINSVILLVQNKIRLVTTENTPELRKLVFQNDKKIALDIFLEKKFGLARHQILLAAYLLEKVTEAGHLKGKIYIDGITNETLERNERLVYSSGSGNLFVFNPEGC